MQEKIIKIHVLGMDERSCETLRLFFQKFCGNCCEMSGKDTAQAFLINMDSAGAEKELEQLNKTYPGLPLILTSIKTIETDAHYFLRKPMIADHLITIVEEINGVFSSKISPKKQNKVAVESKEVQSLEPQPFTLANTRQQLSDKEITAFVGEAEDIDLRSPIRLNKIFFNMDEHFLSHLKRAYQKAKKENCAIKVTGLWKPIIIFAESNQIYIEMSDQQLKSICAVSLDSSSIAKADIKLKSLTPQKAALFCEKNKNFQRLDSFMWKIALWTSRGRLPQGMPINSALYLLGWPNLTRLNVTPEAFRITACWVLYPRTIINLTEVLAIPQRYVFSFITACYILGLSGQANRESDHLLLPPDANVSSKINLFSRTMKKLKSGK